jgi:TonB family protein
MKSSLPKVRGCATVVLSAAVLCALGTASLAARGQMMKAEDAGKKGEDTAAKDPVLDAAAQYIGRALFVRCLCTADTLSFEASGRAAPGAKWKPIDWTLAAVDIAKVSRKDAETIELEGTRVGMRWNDDQKEFYRQKMKTEPVKITIAGAGSAEGMDRALAEVFSVGIDHRLEAATPPFWQHYFNPALAWPEDGLKGPIPVVGTKVVGVEIASPALVKKSPAEFTIEAQRDKVQGPVTLQLVVDAAGRTERIRVVGPLGYGLDASAAEAAAKTTFAPPVVAGKPGAVAMLIKENFSFVAPATF